MAELSALPMDVFHFIILLLVKSSGGAQDFAKAMPVSRAFRDAAKDSKVMEAMSFDNVSVPNIFRAFHLGSDLFFICAEAGNPSAQHLLSKVLLMTCSQLYIRERSHPSNILDSSDPTQIEDLLARLCLYRDKFKESGRSHSELVLNFLRRCTPIEIIELGEHLIRYVRYFTQQETVHHTLFYRRIEEMVRFGKDAEAGPSVELDDMRRKAYAICKSLMKTLGASSSDKQGKEMCPALYYFRQCRVEALEAFESFQPLLKK